MTTRDENMIAALLRERDVYQRQGKKDRVEQVDDQLRHLGYSPDSEDQGDSEPQGRTPADPGQQTADASVAQAAAAADAAAGAGGDTTAATTEADGAKAAPVGKAAPAKKTAAARGAQSKG